MTTSSAVTANEVTPRWRRFRGGRMAGRVEARNTDSRRSAQGTARLRTENAFFRGSHRKYGQTSRCRSSARRARGVISNKCRVDPPELFRPFSAHEEPPADSSRERSPPPVLMTDVVESPFDAVRLRTSAAKRLKRVENAVALILQLLLAVKQHFRTLNVPHRCAKSPRAPGAMACASSPRPVKGVPPDAVYTRPDQASRPIPVGTPPGRPSTKLSGGTTEMSIPRHSGSRGVEVSVPLEQSNFS